MNAFRTLKADEIDVRIGQTGKGYVTLLLYKDARCDMAILDEAVGPMNWKREHTRDNANCIVSLWDSEKGQWIGKEDTGTESKTEAEKGLASDSFKRACVNWGIGRELYTAPRIYVRGDVETLKKEKFAVAEIGYNANREINKLAIANKSGTLVSTFGNVTVKYMPIPVEDAIEPRPAPKQEQQPAQQQEQKQMTAWEIAHQNMWEKENTAPFDPKKKIAEFCNQNQVSAANFGKVREALIAGGVVKDIPSGQMTPVDCEALFQAIKANYPDMMRATA